MRPPCTGLPATAQTAASRRCLPLVRCSCRPVVLTGLFSPLFVSTCVGAKPDAVDSHSCHPLHDAASSDEPEAAKLLLATGP